MADLETLAKDSIHTDVRTFYQIAQESIATMRKDAEGRRQPKPNGEPGFVISFDPQRRGFKASFIATVFSGVFLEAVLHLLIAGRKGTEAAKKLDRKTYEAKLKALGCRDENILALCKQYADSRREIVHEKAYLDDSFRIAQVEAEAAITLIEKLIDFFEIREKLALNPAK